MAKTLKKSSKGRKGSRSRKNRTRSFWGGMIPPFLAYRIFTKGREVYKNRSEKNKKPTETPSVAKA
jgi:hypothetical protein